MAYTTTAVRSQQRKLIGLAEYPAGSNRNKVTTWYADYTDQPSMRTGAWCDMQTVYAAFHAAGVVGAALNGVYAYTPWHAEWFRKNGRFGVVPRVGALVFYDWGRSGRGARYIPYIDHVGWVEAVHSDGTFTAIEGNIDNRCKRIRRSMAYVVGFGYPNYDGSGAPPSGGGQADTRYLQSGDVGPEVEAWQRNLMKWNPAALPEWKADGEFGDETEDWTRRFQEWADIEVDGVVGPESQTAMKAALSKDDQEPTKPGDVKPAPKPDARPTAPAWPGVYLTQPPAMRHPAAGTWQQRMADRGWNIAVDNWYGPASEAVCRAFQQEKEGLEVDGVVGPNTWSAAWTEPIT